MDRNLNAGTHPVPAMSQLSEIRCGIARINEAHDNITERLEAVVARLDRRYGIPKDADSDSEIEHLKANPGELPVMIEMLDYSEQKIGDLYSLVAHLEGLL